MTFYYAEWVQSETKYRKCLIKENLVFLLFILFVGSNTIRLRDYRKTDTDLLQCLEC